MSVPPSPASQYPLIGTHDGSFHCDEALAISMLTTLPEYSKSSVLRTRNPDHLAQCAVVVDVGAVYDPERHRYDHHQREFTGTFGESKRIKLSSAGLVFKHFGKRVIGQMLEELKGVESSPALVDVSHEKLYSSFIEHIDAIDNGVEVADGELKYQVSTTVCR